MKILDVWKYIKTAIIKNNFLRNNFIF
jgi:hypothetical protein